MSRETLTNDQLELALEEMNKKLLRLEETQLQLSVLNTYICDKNKFPMEQILEMLFTVDKNVEIVRANLTDPEDVHVLNRVVDKWKRAKDDAVQAALDEMDNRPRLVSIN